MPLTNARRCLLELRAWLDSELADPSGLRPHFPIEIRFTEADDIWISPSYGQRMCWIGIVQYKYVRKLLLLMEILTHYPGQNRPYGFNVPYRRLFEVYESIVIRHGGKPHWAKAHGLRPADLRKLYPKFGDFTKIIEDVDPNGLFRNEYVRRHIFGDKSPEVHERIFKPSR